MTGTTLGSATIGLLLACAQAQPPVPSAKQLPDKRSEMICRPVGDLEPWASAGEIEPVPSELSDAGSLTRWPAAAGETLRLKLRASDPGAYEISIRVVHSAEGPALSARAWEVSLTREGEARFSLQGPSPKRLLDIRFDPIPLGPGYHVLELECLVPGEVLIDCVGLRRTGDTTAEIGRPGANVEESAFLGVHLGAAQRDGVTINRAILDTVADEAGIQPGDVLVSIDGVRVTTLEGAQDAIASYRPGDRVEIELLRDGERISKPVQLGSRPESEQVHVIDVLQVRPGQVIADIGSGSGWLSEAIAEALGPEGTVYAVEIQQRRVRQLHRRSIPNVVPVLSVSHDVSLPEASLDTAMLHDVASHIDRSARPSFYKSVARALKPNGRLVIFGPHGKAQAMLSELRKHGFVPVDEEALTALSAEDLDERLDDGIVFRHE